MSLPSLLPPATGRRGQAAAVAPHAADRSHNLLLDVAQRGAEFAGSRLSEKGRGSLRGRGREYEFSIDADLTNQWERNAEIYFTLLREHGACLLPIPSCLVLPPPFRLHR